MPWSVFLFVSIFLAVLITWAVLFSRITVVLHVFYRENLVVQLHIRIFGKNIKTMELYPRNKPKKGTGGLSPVMQLSKVPQLKKVETAFFVNCCVGLPDAAATAVSTGILQGLFSGILAVPGNFTTMKALQIEVVPSYNKTCFIFNGICIARSRLGNIIIGAIHYKKMKRK